MKRVVLIPALLLSVAAWAAEPKTNFVDHSNALLIDAATAKSVMAEAIPAKVWKIHPGSRYTFASQVQGGMKGSTCVVVARVMLLPLTQAAKAVLLRPLKTATAYDAVPNSTPEQCKDTAREQLKEATGAVVSAIVKT